MLNPGKASSSTFNARTYGRKSAIKRRKYSDSTAAEKRRKILDDSETLTDNGKDDRSPGQRSYGSLKLRDGSPMLGEGSLGILKPVSSTPSPSTPVKLAQRKLGRSKTDSSLSTPSRLQVDRTPSMPNLPSHTPPNATSDLPALAATNMRTYAGKSRSFLIALPASALDGAFPGREEEDEFTRESYTSLRTRWGVDDSEDESYPPNVAGSPSGSNSTPKKSPGNNSRKRRQQNQETQLRTSSLPGIVSNPLKSITELRSKGESRRFFDEIGYLFEGMNPEGGIGLRRTSALEITVKLCDTDFARKAKAADFFEKIWDAFLEAGASKGEDKLLDSILAFFCALVSRDPSSLAELAQRSQASVSQSMPNAASLVGALFSLLEAPEDPLALIASTTTNGRVFHDIELKSTKIGRKEKALFLRIHDIITTKSSLFPSGTPISMSLLVVQSLATLPSSLIPRNYFPVLLSSLKSHFASALPITSMSSAHFKMADAAQRMSFLAIHHHLSLLDTYILRQWGPVIVNGGSEDGGENDRKRIKTENIKVLEKARSEWLAFGLIATGICTELRKGSQALTCMYMTLRVLVSLTHGDELWAKQILEYEPTLGFIFRLILSSDLARGGATHQKVARDKVLKIKGKNRSEQELDEEAEYISSEDDDPPGDGSTHVLDRLCLALGLLTNLVQTVDDMKEILRVTRLNPSCTLKQRACIRTCMCPQSMSICALDVLVRLYDRQTHPRLKASDRSVEDETLSHSSAPESVDSDFLQGHLAVLFGLLMDGSPDNQRHILNALRGTAGSDYVTLQRLAEQASEFARMYDTLSEGVGEKEDKVAKNVVIFLNNLRDCAASG